MLTQPGETVWRAETAHRAAVLIDMAAYFKAVKSVLPHARRTVHLLGWAFDPDTYFAPGEDGGGPSRDRIGAYLRHLACNRDDLDVRVLVWKSALPVAASQDFFPHRAKRCFKGSPVKFLLDASIPLGACHHQKMIVIDDSLAFCGGGDIAPDRWDTTAHADDDPRRVSRKGRPFPSRHEVMTLIEGPAAAALGELFRARWRRATDEALPTPATHDLRHGDAPRAREPQNEPEEAADLWPSHLPVEFRDVRVGVARSEPRWRAYPQVRETERLYLASIAGARRTIYLENQYFASPIIAEALATRLAEPDGPEVVIVSTQHSPSWFDQMTMDRTRLAFLARLTAADAQGRAGGGKLTAFCPVTAKGRTIIVHAKLAVIDDTLLRIGSANLNNRSTGFDTECDLAFEAADGAAGAATRAAVRRVRSQLVAHWLGRTDVEIDAAVAAHGGLGRAILAIDPPQARRLHPITPRPLGPLAGLIATFHLGDPAGPSDSWRPWRRRAEMRAQLDRLATDLERAGLPAPAHDLDPTTV